MTNYNKLKTQNNININSNSNTNTNNNNNNNNDRKLQVKQQQQKSIPLIPQAKITATPKSLAQKQEVFVTRQKSAEARSDLKMMEKTARVNDYHQQKQQQQQQMMNSDNMSNMKQQQQNQHHHHQVKPPSRSAQVRRNQEQEIWNSMENLFWHHMEEVQNKWSTLKLNDDIWAKLIYFEQNRRLAKAYVSAPVLTIDGSSNGLDGFRIGLSGIDNIYRNLDTIRCLRSIGPGLKLKIDSQGNILIRKIGSGGGTRSGQQQVSGTTTNNPSSSSSSSTSSSSSSAAGGRCSIWIRNWPSGSSTNHSSNNSNHPKQTHRTSSATPSSDYTILEIDESDMSYKLFDMRKFRLQLEKMKLSNMNGANYLDWHQCVTIINFAPPPTFDDKKHQKEYNSDSFLENPCWLMLINIIAIDMLKSSFCDRININNNNNNNNIMSRSSSLIKQHSLLESTQHQNHNKSKQHHRNHHLSSSSMINKLTNGPLRSSSSASILTPLASSNNENLQDVNGHSESIADHYNTSSMNSSNKASNSSRTESLMHNLQVASNERVKKLRTANSRYRPSSTMLRNDVSSNDFAFDAMKRASNSRYINNNDYRKYQSTYQLSSSTSVPDSNNTIYTTFNSKFLNSFSRSHFDNSSTLNYNSIARSTPTGQRSNPASSSYNNHEFTHRSNNRNNQSVGVNQYQNPMYPLDSSLTRLRNDQSGFSVLRDMTRSGSALDYNNDENYKISSQRKILPLTTNNQKLNSSTLSSSRFEPKSVSLSTIDLSHRRLDLKSSIKMNYDNDEDDFVFRSKNPQVYPNEDLDFYRLEEEEEKCSNIVSSGEQKLLHPYNDHPYSAISTSESGDSGHCGNSNETSQDLDDSKLICPTAEEAGSESIISLKNTNTCCCDLRGKNISTLITSTTHLPSTTNTNSSKSSISQREDVRLNHHFCAAMHGSDLLTRRDINESIVASRERSQQKVSRSSVDSSSSSSGCVDNDYFMSHFSSSMSSSTASNERELFSQPASSSGIICSGSTSDEYEADGLREANLKQFGDDENEHTNKSPKQPLHPKKVTSLKDESTKDGNGSNKSEKKLDNHLHRHHQSNHRQTSHHHHSAHCSAFNDKLELEEDHDSHTHSVSSSRRVHNNKTAFAVGCACVALEDGAAKNESTAVDKNIINGDYLEECDCPTVEYHGELHEVCDCECDCFSSSTQSLSLTLETTSNPIKRSEQSKANNQNISTSHNKYIYRKLPHPLEVASSKGSLLNEKNDFSDDTSSSRINQKSGSGIKITSRSASKNENQEKIFEDNGTQGKDNGTNEKLVDSAVTKEFKATSSWRCGKILPKFIFSSSSSSRHQMSTSSSEQKTGRTLSRKSNTLEREGKFRIIKSTLDLS